MKTTALVISVTLTKQPLKLMLKKFKKMMALEILAHLLEKELQMLQKMNHLKIKPQLLL